MTHNIGDLRHYYGLPQEWSGKEWVDLVPRGSASEKPNGCGHNSAAALEMAPITREHALEKAKSAVADRGEVYGNPKANFERTARRWRAHIENRYGIVVPIDAASVAIMSADVKFARLEESINHADSWVDVAGYAACGAEITGGK